MGTQFPGHRITMGTPNECGGHRMTAAGVEMSQQCHKYILQHSAFTSVRPQF